MYRSRKITRKDIDKENMIALGYCQIQHTLNLFGEEFKVGYNAGVYGWNYDLYNINGISVVTGYNVPYREYSNEEIKNKLIIFENKLNKCSLEEYRKNKEKLKKEFLEIFEI